MENSFKTAVFNSTRIEILNDELALDARGELSPDHQVELYGAYIEEVGEEQCAYAQNYHDYCCHKSSQCKPKPHCHGRLPDNCKPSAKPHCRKSCSSSSRSSCSSRSCSSSSSGSSWSSDCESSSKKDCHRPSRHCHEERRC